MHSSNHALITSRRLVAEAAGISLLRPPATPSSPAGKDDQNGAMIARRKLRPGQPGTRKLLAEYGEKLVCVRYRYDAANKRRIKTIELVIEEAPWEPKPAKLSLNKIMHLRIKYGEVALGRQVKAAGGKWNREKQAWELPYQEVLKLGLVERIIDSINN